MPKRFQNILKDKSGASLIFVLGFWLLFLALGTSAIFAASTAVGSDIDRQVIDRLDLQADSLQKTIMHSLQASDAAALPGTLGEWLLTALYGAYYDSVADSITPLPIFPRPDPASDPDDPPPSLPLTTGGGVGGAVQNCAVGIQIRAKPGRASIVEGDPAETVSISGIVTVTVTAAHDRQSIRTVVTYDLSNALIDAGAGIVNAGDWRFVSYDKIGAD